MRISTAPLSGILLTGIGLIGVAVDLLVWWSRRSSLKSLGQDASFTGTYGPHAIAYYSGAALLGVVLCLWHWRFRERHPGPGSRPPRRAGRDGNMAASP